MNTSDTGTPVTPAAVDLGTGQVPYARHSVPVDGGELTVGVWGDEGPLVVAAHGITSSHVAFMLVGRDLGRDHRVVAVDLRGRGGSRDLPGPYGMARHAADLAAVVDAYGGGPAVLVGHSMGGFVVARAVRDFPLLASRLVLIDGGAPLPVPPGVDPDGGEEEIAKAIEQTVGTAYARLTQTFPDRAAYREMWRAHPSFADWNEAMTAYVEYDLVGEEPRLRPACLLQAAVRDARDLYAAGGVHPEALPVPATFLRAERGMLDEADRPLYAPGYAGQWLPGVTEIDVPGVNHYTIVLAPAGTEAIARAVRRPDEPSPIPRSRGDS